MKTRIIVTLIFWCVLSRIALPQQQTPRQKPADTTTTIDPRAMAALNRMSDYLKTAKTFRLDSEVTKDEVVNANMKVQKRSSNTVRLNCRDVAMRR
jgi:hypothetical protein